MNKPNLKKLVRNVRIGIGEHSPKILMGVGIAGMVTTTVVAVKATPKALKMIEEAENDKMEKQLEDGVKPTEIIETLTPLETVKATWKAYVPAAVIGAVSIACLLGSCSVSGKRTAALATAYKLSEAALSEYKDAVIETIGEKKAEEVLNKKAEKQLAANPVGKNEIIFTGKGTALCYDTLSGRYFQSDMNTIKKAENEMNLCLREENYISLNSFYDMLNLEPTKFGEELGWNIETDGYVDIEVSAQIAEDQTPCLVLDFSSMPRYDYWKL